MRKYKSGVRYQKSKNAWLSVFIDNNNNYRELYFSVSKYGEEAKQMAINFRVSMMKQYNYVYDKDMYGESSETIESK